MKSIPHFFFFISFFIMQSGLFAQSNVYDRKTDTLETVLDKNDLHKDGYGIKGWIMEIPESLITKYNGQKVRIIGRKTFYNIETQERHGKHEKEIMQGRYEYSVNPGDTGRSRTEQRMVPTGSNFSVLSVETWNERKKRWKIVYELK